MKKQLLVIIVIIVLLAVGGGSFYGGMLYGKSQNIRPAGFPSSFNGNMQGLGTKNGSNFISGEIISKDSNSITLQLPNNSGSKIIFYSSATQISKSATGTSEDLAVGTSVSVTGITSSDGSVAAQSIQIRQTGQIPEAGSQPPVQ